MKWQIRKIGSFWWITPPGYSGLCKFHRYDNFDDVLWQCTMISREVTRVTKA
jgi:hypothetical protein